MNSSLFDELPYSRRCSVHAQQRCERDDSYTRVQQRITMKREQPVEEQREKKAIISHQRALSRYSPSPAVAMLLITKLASFCTSHTPPSSWSITPCTTPGASHTTAIWAGVPATMLLSVQQVSCHVGRRYGRSGAEGLGGGIVQPTTAAPNVKT